MRKEPSLCCCIRGRRVKNKEGRSRLEIHSFPLSIWSLIIPAVLMALMFFFQTLYKQALLKYTLGPDGITKTQKQMSKGIINILSVITEFGGGIELFDAWIICFLFGTRSKSMYYLAMVALDKSVVNFLKLAMAEPRPYMIDSQIYPYTCSKAFGMPSGHSSAAFAIGLVIFLDIFHGKTEPFFKGVYSGWFTYLAVFLFFIGWAVCIPFSRYLLGAHSLDQIVYGISNGVCEGLILHFFVRDPFIKHIENVLAVQNLGQEQRQAEIRKMHLNMFMFSQSGTSHLINPIKYVICSLVFLVFYTAASIVTFEIINAKLKPESETVQAWIKNYSTSCGKMDLTYSLQNASLNGCAFIVLPVFMYVFTLYRNRIFGLCHRNPELVQLQDFNTYGDLQGKLIFIRVFVAFLMCLPLTLPAAFLRVDMVQSPVFIMFSNVFIPGTIMSGLLVLGPYDLLVNKIY